MDETDKIRAGSALESYRIDAVLGEGAAGTVYAVEDMRTGAQFALKAFTPRKGDLQHMRKKFLAEAKLLAKLDHPNIVKVRDSGVDEATGRPFFVMDKVVYKDGLPCTLNDVETQDLDEDYLVGWFGDLAAALDYIHDMGVVHRDIKCGNVLIRPDKNAVLSDFGISKIFSDSLAEELQVERTVPVFVENGVQKTRFKMGTAGYMAPEVVRGEPATGKSDIYSLGVIFFRMLTGIWYAPGSVAMELLEMYDYRWDKVLPWMLDEDPGARPCRLIGLVRILAERKED
jgi:serine/threonine-protein kinase